MKETKKIGKDAFDEYYRSIYKDRWDPLKASLLNENNDKIKIKDIKIDYFIDKASYIAAKTLGVEKRMNVLDMCSCPGGKTLILLKELNGEGSITANDISKVRRLRMLKTFSDALDTEERDLIKVTPFDGKKFGLYHKGEYDRILLDAPCSSEAHVIKSKEYLDKWTINRTKRLSKDQFSLLSSALLSLKEGGRVLYSTCSISPLENEGIIKKALERHKDKVKEIKLSIDGFEPLEYGIIALPDSSNMGPMYMSLLELTKSIS